MNQLQNDHLLFSFPFFSKILYNLILFALLIISLYSSIFHLYLSILRIRIFCAKQQTDYYYYYLSILILKIGNQIYKQTLKIYKMQKKKLLESFPKDLKIKEQPILSHYFKSHDTTSILFELYDKFILSYQTTHDKKEITNKISFEFDVIFQMLRGTNEEQIKKKIGKLYGLKFQKQEESYCMFSDDVETLKLWRNALACRLNQRGFHQLFKPIKKIGKGNFASVYLAIRIQDQKKFAIKAFSKQATYAQDKGKESLVNQIQLMRKFNHKNLMKLYQVYQSQNSIYVSVQLLQGGQLYDKIKAKYKFTSQQVQTILKGLLQGLQHMHAKRVMHRDLKPQNILLRKQNNFDCVIADFGLATWADEPEYLFVRCGTPGYVAPQIVNIKDMKTKSEPICDVFSLGVIFHILVTGKSPFPGKTYNQVLAQNRACNINFQTQECLKLSTKTLDLLKKMLEKNPKNRISATQALKHEFFASQQKLPTKIIQEEQIFSQNQPPKIPINKTSILKSPQSPSILLNSPLMTTSNPFRKTNVGGLLKDDSCLKFKMKENIMTGTSEGTSNIDSPNMKRNTSTIPTKQSKFGLQKKILQKRDTNKMQ